jgi:hypothetical protein
LAVSSSTLAWTLRMPAGSSQEWEFTLTTGTPTYIVPYPIPGGSSWEYVARTTPTGTGTPLFAITPTPGAAGQLTITSTAVLSRVLLAMTGTATAALAPGAYYHCLWLNPGLPSALAVFDGQLLIDAAPAS